MDLTTIIVSAVAIAAITESLDLAQFARAALRGVVLASAVIGAVVVTVGSNL